MISKENMMIESLPYKEGEEAKYYFASIVYLLSLLLGGIVGYIIYPIFILPGAMIGQFVGYKLFRRIFP